MCSAAARAGDRGFITRVGLFDFGADPDQFKLVEDFEDACRRLGITVRSGRGYSPSSFTYAIECRDVKDVDALSRIVGVRSIAPMPLIRTIRTRMSGAQPLPALPTAESVTEDFPVVVVVDSGVSDALPELESWVVGRDSQVAPEYRNPITARSWRGSSVGAANSTPVLRDSITARAVSSTSR